MNNKIIEDLVDLGIYDSRYLTEEEYNNLSKNNNKKYLYITGRYEGGNDDYNRYFKKINTNGLSLNEARFQLEINRTKYIKFIKNMVMFFVVITVISIIVAFFFGLSLTETLSDMRY